MAAQGREPDLRGHAHTPQSIYNQCIHLRRYTYPGVWRSAGPFFWSFVRCTQIERPSAAGSTLGKGNEPNPYTSFFISYLPTYMHTSVCITRPITSKTAAVSDEEPHDHYFVEKETPSTRLADSCVSSDQARGVFGRHWLRCTSWREGGASRTEG